MENTETKIQEEKQTEEKTFTQAELNAIVQKRVGEVTGKYEDYEELKEKAQKFDALEEESKTELEKATEERDALKKKLESMEKAEEVRQIREDVSKEKGVPANLLKGDTKEECEKQADDILAFTKNNVYPVVRDKGEAKTSGTGGSTREQFADWVEENFQGGE